MLSNHPAATVARCQHFLGHGRSGQQIPALLYCPSLQQLTRPRGLGRMTFYLLSSQACILTGLSLAQRDTAFHCAAVLNSFSCSEIRHSEVRATGWIIVELLNYPTNRPAVFISFTSSSYISCFWLDSPKTWFKTAEWLKCVSDSPETTTRSDLLHIRDALGDRVL